MRITRKAALLLVVGGSALAAGVAVMPATAAPTTPLHTLEMKGSIRFHDSEVVRDKNYTRSINSSVDLQNGGAYGYISADRGAGGELRLTITGDAFMDANERVCVRNGRIKFFEGTSEKTNDLAEQTTFGEVCVSTDQTSGHITGTLRNTGRGGGDRAAYDFTFTNRVNR